MQFILETLVWGYELFSLLINTVYVEINMYVEKTKRSDGYIIWGRGAQAQVLCDNWTNSYIYIIICFQGWKGYIFDDIFRARTAPALSFFPENTWNAIT